MATVSDRSWAQFTPADYSIAQWIRACLVDRGEGDAASKERYAVPVREPDGTLNRGGVHAALGGHGLQAVQGISDAVRTAAAKELMGLCKTIGEDAPPSLMDMAGMAGPAKSGPMAGRSQEWTVRDTMYRSFNNPDLQVRSSGDGRTIYGIAVPYNAPTRIDDVLVEEFCRGAFNHQLRSPNRVKFAREHVKLGGTLIGAAAMLRDDAAGLYCELRASDTPTGNETLQLVKDGALDQLSIMFRERQNQRTSNGITQRLKADLMEVAVVLEGAYGELAAAVGVRSAAGMPVAVDELDLRAAAEEFLSPGALPPAPDYDLEIRMLRLGMPPR